MEDALCKICKSAFTIYTLRKCKHEACVSCLYDHIQKYYMTKVKCIYSQCKSIIKDSDIRNFISVYQINEYEKLYCKINGQKCLTPKCTYYYLAEDLNDLIFMCHECKQPNCLNCQARHFPNECNSPRTLSEEEIDEKALEALKDLRLETLKNYDEEYMLLPGNSSLVCEMCFEFILPKDVIMLRCGHDYHRACFKRHYETLEYLNQLKCMMEECKEEFTPIEKLSVAGEEKLITMSFRILTNRLFHCQNNYCEQMWYVNSKIDTIKCSECDSVNCISCQTIHDNMTCKQFKKTDLFKLNEKDNDKVKTEKHIKCYQCTVLLIHGDKCAAMKCRNCNVSTCLFLGLKSGLGGCNCTSANPCHPDCKYGCFEEDDSMNNIYV